MVCINDTCFAYITQPICKCECCVEYSEKTHTPILHCWTSATDTQTNNKPVEEWTELNNGERMRSAKICCHLTKSQSAEFISDISPAQTCDRPAPKLFRIRSRVIVYVWMRNTDRKRDRAALPDTCSQW